VLVVNRRREASEAIAEMFAYFRHETEVMELEAFERRRPPLARFDIFVVEEPLVDPMLVDYIGKIRKHQALKVVTVRNIFAPETPHFDASAVDARLSKPLTIERVHSLIEEFYGMERGEEARPDKPAALETLPEKATPAPEVPAAPVREFWEEVPTTPGVGLKELGSFAGSTLLIVEDNEINRRMLLKVLEHSGLRLLTAENGEKALETVAQEGKRIDLVLMDINMPVMDGYTATRKIRELPGTEKLPIVALSALSLQNEREKMREVGMDGFLPKPLDLGKLYTVFERYLPRGERKQAVPEPRPLYPEALDMETALEHTNRNELLLQDILGEFLELYGESDRQLRAWIEGGEVERAQAMLVDLVGITGTIGATRLYASVKELYRALILHRMDRVEGLLERYAAELEVLNRSVAAYLESVKG
jgi:CheY-like chemotaxis protein